MSANVGEVSVISSKFKWVITNFCMNCKNIGDVEDSPRFTTTSVNNNISWYLQLHPKGKTEESKDYVSLFLFSTAKIKAVASFRILNNKGIVMKTFNLEESVFGDTSEYNGWGKKKFVKRDFITDPANGILKDDKLTIMCKITLSDHKVNEKSDEEVEEEEAEEEPDNVLHRLEMAKYESLINDDTFSDVLLISEGKSVKVYKGILAKSSSVFAVMFGAEMKEKLENTVEIADIKYDVLVEMVRFVYAGKVNDIDAIAGELAAAADKYALDGLKTMCERTMCKNLSVENAVEYLELADRHRMDKLKRKTIEFSVAHAEDVIEKPEFQSLPCNVMYEVCLAATAKK